MADGEEGENKQLSLLRYFTPEISGTEVVSG